MRPVGGARRSLRALVKGALVSGLAVAIQSNASAQSEPTVDGVALGTYVATADYVARLNTYIVGYETWIGPCPDPEPVARIGTLLPQRTVRLPGNPDPSAPQWIEMMRIGGCGTPYERPVYVSAKGGKPVFHAVLLGSTQTSPQVQAEAVDALIATERDEAAARGCPMTQPVRILSTAYGSEFEAEYGRGWTETWSIIDCAGLREIDIRFAPDHSSAMRFELSESRAK